MGRPLAGFGFFNDVKRLDAETEGFEKILIHAFLTKEEEPKEWVKDTFYTEGSKVKNGGSNYVCKAENTQSVFAEKESAPSAWEATHQYNVDDKVENDGSYYKCSEAHQSSEEFATDSQKWESYELVVYWESYTLGGGVIEDAKIIKQTGYNKYLVAATADENRKGVIRLVDEKDATKEGTGYIKVTKTADSSEAYALKIVRNVVETFEGEQLKYKYEVSEDKEGKLSGKFVQDKDVVECYPETLS